MSRNAYALEQLISEVVGLFPGVEVEEGEADGLDVVRSVRFEGVSERVGEVLNLVPDARLASTHYDAGVLTVELRPESTLADSRESFNLADGVAVLEGQEENGEEGEETISPDPGSGAAEPDADRTDSKAGAQKRRRSGSSS